MCEAMVLLGTNRSRQSIDGILGRRKAQAESKDLVGCCPCGIRTSSGPAMTSPVNVAMRRQVERKAWPRTNEKKGPQIPSASLGAGTSTARRHDPHNHPNDRKGGARWGDPEKKRVGNSLRALRSVENHSPRRHGGHGVLVSLEVSQ